LAELPRPESLGGHGAWFGLGGGQELHIGVEEAFAPARKAHPGLRVAPGELDRLAERLTAAGAPVIWDERLSDRRRFYTADPWGNRIELLAYEPPTAPRQASSSSAAT
jgi:hypothetical protein